MRGSFFRLRVGLSREALLFFEMPQSSDRKKADESKEDEEEEERRKKTAMTATGVGDKQSDGQERRIKASPREEEEADTQREGLLVCSSFSPTSGATDELPAFSRKNSLDGRPRDLRAGLGLLLFFADAAGVFSLQAP